MNPFKLDDHPPVGLLIGHMSRWLLADSPLLTAVSSRNNTSPHSVVITSRYSDRLLGVPAAAAARSEPEPSGSATHSMAEAVSDNESRKRASLLLSSSATPTCSATPSPPPTSTCRKGLEDRSFLRFSCVPSCWITSSSVVSSICPVIHSSQFSQERKHGASRSEASHSRERPNDHSQYPFPPLSKKSRKKLRSALRDPAFKDPLMQVIRVELQRAITDLHGNGTNLAPNQTVPKTLDAHQLAPVRKRKAPSLPSPRGPPHASRTSISSRRAPVGTAASTLPPAFHPNVEFVAQHGRTLVPRPDGGRFAVVSSTGPGAHSGD